MGQCSDTHKKPILPFFALTRILGKSRKGKEGMEGTNLNLQSDNSTTLIFELAWRTLSNCQREASYAKEDMEGATSL